MATIDLNTLKKMPFRTKIAGVLVVFCLVGAMFWFNFLQGAVEKRSMLQAKIQEMQEKIDGKSKLVDQIKQIQAEVAGLKDKYKIALLKLPDQREIPTLLHSVASEGRDAGITFISFVPKASVPRLLDKSKEKTGAAAKSTGKPAGKESAKSKDLPPEIAKLVESKKGASSKASTEPFYEEIPVAVTISGTFQNTLFFFDKLAKLPRIVNVTDLTMTRLDTSKDPKAKTMVETSCLIKTYMFVEKKEQPSEKSSEKPGVKPNEKK
jgi:type IV pilus assembly protein PilO